MSKKNIFFITLVFFFSMNNIYAQEFSQNKEDIESYKVNRNLLEHKLITYHNITLNNGVYKVIGSDPQIIFNELNIPKEYVKGIYINTTNLTPQNKYVTEIFWTNEISGISSNQMISFVTDINTHILEIPFYCNYNYLSSSWNQINLLRYDIDVPIGTEFLLEDLNLIFIDEEINDDLIPQEIKHNKNSILSHGLSRFIIDIKFMLFYLFLVILIAFLLVKIIKR